eukprot:TRINITY_DN12414_c0_g1_i1.p1 TRINITY_DN12414_c0_g1~~TRINITY_DN12414_c0_g1_i1.p1  ORF type:complete len:483 (+),score=105.60 TRINITY_DN12414_c0_g1_i1:58-1449(+)
MHRRLVVRLSRQRRWCVEDIFAFDAEDEQVPGRPIGEHWITRYERGKQQRQRQRAAKTDEWAQRRAVKYAEDEENKQLVDTVLAERDKGMMLHEANKLAPTSRWGTEKAALIAKHGAAMALRITAEERELARQVKAHDTILETRKEMGLHPIHFVKRWDSRWDEHGEDKVPYSQERIEKEKGKWLLEDSLARKKLEAVYEKLGWEKESLYMLMKDWYSHLPEPDRFFQQPYYKSMRPAKIGRRQGKMLAKMKKETSLVVFEERNTHRVIREAIDKGEMPFVKLPSPRIIWEPLPEDCIIDDFICGQDDVTLERRQGAILLRRWLPNGQKISCEAIGAEYLNDIPHPTPMHVDYGQIEQNGGFLIHNIMVNSVDHHNNFKIVGRVEEAVAVLKEFSPHPDAEFDARDYRFYPYLWVTNPSHYTGEADDDVLRREISSADSAATLGFSGNTVSDYKESRKDWRGN